MLTWWGRPKRALSEDPGVRGGSGRGEAGVSQRPPLLRERVQCLRDPLVLCGAHLGVTEC